MDRYARQRGLVAQDIVADADIAVHGTGAPLTYLLHCLALAGAATRHGRIRLCLHERLVSDTDLAYQFLLRTDDLGRPIGQALTDRIHEVNPAVAITVTAAPSGPRGLNVAVPAAGEADEILAGFAPIAIWGQISALSVLVGRDPVTVAGDRRGGALTAALAAVCGGLVAQTILGQLGAVISGPAVLDSWFEEHLRIAYPGIGRHANVAIARGVPWPSLRGVVEQACSAVVAESFGISLDGKAADPRITTVVDDDTVVVSVPGPPAQRPRAVERPYLATPAPVEPIVWSPVAGAELKDGRLTESGLPVPAQLPQARVVLCGAGALGTWASAVLAASGLPGLSLCVVDMDETIESHNLNRQVLFGDGDIGQPKARRAVQRLAEIDPAMDLRALEMAISPSVVDEILGTGQGFEILDEGIRRARARYQSKVDTLKDALRTASAVLSCPDNHQTRWTLNVLSERLGIPLINGAVVGLTGRMHVCDPGDHGQCLVCWLGTSIADEVDRHSCTDLVGDTPVPSIVTSAAIVGAAQAAALIAHLAGFGSRLNRIHILEGSDGTLAGYRGPDRDDADCPAHLAVLSAASEGC